MKSRERILRLFAGKEIDHTPIWLLNPVHKVDFYTDIFNNPQYKRLIPYMVKYCDHFDRRSYGTGVQFNGNTDIVTENRSYDENGNHFDESIISYKDFKLRSYTRRGKDPTEKRYFISDACELEKLLDIPYVPVKPDFSRYKKEKEEMGDMGVMMMDLGDPLTPLYNLMSAEDFAVATLTDYDVMLKFLDTISDRCIAVYKEYLENNIGDCFFIVGAEFAGPPLVPPYKFNELSARYVKRITDLIRSYGKYSIVHYHGNLYSVLDGFKTIGMDALHTIEAPPIGDCTITQAREKLGDTILIGNIQYDDLTRLSQAEISDMTKDILQEAKGGRFILSPTAGPYEDNPTQRLIDNYIAMIKTAAEIM